MNGLKEMLSGAEKVRSQVRIIKRVRSFRENNHEWKGDKTGYSSKHNWIHKYYGKANKCENHNCKIINPKRYEWANLSGKYLREVSDYRMLCVNCHRNMDRNNRCLKMGHELTEENTLYSPDKSRRWCKICRTKSLKEYRDNNKIKRSNDNKIWYSKNRTKKLEYSRMNYIKRKSKAHC